MTMADYETALALVREHRDDADFAGPRDERLVVAAEAALGLIFPPHLSPLPARTRRRRHRLRRDLWRHGRQFHPIIGSERRLAHAAKAITLQVARLDGYSGRRWNGRDFVLDTARTGANGECPVAVWEPGLGGDDDLEIIAPDFGAFLLMIVQEGIASLDEED